MIVCILSPACLKCLNAANIVRIEDITLNNVASRSRYDEKRNKHFLEKSVIRY